MCFALNHFPYDPKVQEAIFSAFIPIQEVCLRWKDVLCSFYMNLVDGNAIMLAVAALEDYATNYWAVLGALTLLCGLGSGCDENPRILQAFGVYVHEHPGIRTIVECAESVQRQFFPDDFHIRKQASMLYSIMDSVGTGDVMMEN